MAPEPFILFNQGLNYIVRKSKGNVHANILILDDHEDDWIFLGVLFGLGEGVFPDHVGLTVVFVLTLVPHL